jgi:hypothetical protein
MRGIVGLLVQPAAVLKGTSPGGHREEFEARNAVDGTSTSRME